MSRDWLDVFWDTAYIKNFIAHNIIYSMVTKHDCLQTKFDRYVLFQFTVIV